MTALDKPAVESTSDDKRLLRAYVSALWTSKRSERRRLRAIAERTGELPEMACWCGAETEPC